MVTGLQTALLRMLRRPGYLIALILCPLMILGCRYLLPKEQQSAQIAVGVAFQEDSPTARALMALLEEEKAGEVVFYPAEEEEMRANVSTGRWECGYLFPDDLEQRLETGEWQNLVTLVVSEHSAVYQPVTEMVSAALLELYWGEIAEGYLDGLGLDVSIDQTLEQALPEENWVAIQVIALDGADGTEQPAGGLDYGSLLPGVVGLWLFMAALLAGGELFRWRQEPYVQYALSGTGLWTLLLPECAVMSLTALLSGLVSLLLAGRDSRAIAGLVLYQMVLTLLSLVLALFSLTGQALPVVLPIMPLLSLAVSPLLVDVSRYLPVMEPVSRCLVLTGYLRLVRGEGAGLLLGQGAVLAGLLLLSVMGPRRR